MTKAVYKDIFIWSQGTKEQSNTSGNLYNFTENVTLWGKIPYEAQDDTY